MPCMRATALRGGRATSHDPTVSAYTLLLLLLVTTYHIASIRDDFLTAWHGSTTYTIDRVSTAVRVQSELD